MIKRIELAPPVATRAALLSEALKEVAIAAGREDGLDLELAMVLTENVLDLAEKLKKDIDRCMNLDLQTHLEQSPF